MAATRVVRRRGVRLVNGVRAPGFLMDPTVRPDEARLILRETELNAVLELFFLAETSLRGAAEVVLRGRQALGPGHYRALFLLKRRGALGVKELARLTGLSKQRTSRVLKDLVDAGLASPGEPAADARRRPFILTPGGAATEESVSGHLRTELAAAYRDAGLDAAVGARRVLAALAGSRAPRNTGL